MADGAASQVLAISDKGGVPLAQEQKELTPLQRMVITKELQRQSEEIEEKQQGAGGHHSAGGQTLNSKAPGTPARNPGGMQGETVEFVNESTQ